MNLNAFYFDGKSSRRHVVRLDVEEGCLSIRGPEHIRRVPLEDLRISEPLGRAPRTLRFPDGAYCEIEQGMVLQALLEKLEHRESSVVRIQKRWRWSFLSLIGVILALLAGYQWGLPWGAKMVTPLVSISTMQEMSDLLLKEVDGRLLHASSLSKARQQKLTLEFQQMAAADPELAPYGDGLQLLFRSAPDIGPNAFALPGGQIILLDELVELPDMEDEELQAVLAHELGHLNERHGTRQLIQSSVVAAVISAYLGDVSYAVSAATTFIFESGYSRDMEREADAYAARVLSRQGKSPALLANALEKMEGFYERKKRKSPSQDETKDTSHHPGHDAGAEKSPSQDETKDTSVFDWFSSHPDTQERIQYLRAF